MNVEQTNKKLSVYTRDRFNFDMEQLVNKYDKSRQTQVVEGKRVAPLNPMTTDEYYRLRAQIENRYSNRQRGFSYRQIGEQIAPLGKGNAINNTLEIAEYPTNTPLFGIELEIECAGTKASFDNLKTCIIEHLPNTMLISTDGSLSNGYEILFKPTSYDDLKANSFQIAKFLKALSKLGFRSHDIDTCGLHIHVSKSVFTPKQIESINNIITGKPWRSFLMGFSRRKQHQLRWCNFSKQTNDRYHALNYKASSQPTIEFRLFRGTLRPDSFLASIELVNILTNLARKDKCNTKEFRKALSGNKKIQAYCSEQGLAIPEPVKRIRRKLTPEERQLREGIRLNNKIRNHDRAVRLWGRTSHGLTCEKAFHLRAQGAPITIIPVSIKSHQRLFKTNLFTPIAYMRDTRRHADTSTMYDYRIYGRNYLGTRAISQPRTMGTLTAWDNARRAAERNREIEENLPF